VSTRCWPQCARCLTQTVNLTLHVLSRRWVKSLSLTLSLHIQSLLTSLMIDWLIESSPASSAHNYAAQRRYRHNVYNDDVGRSIYYRLENEDYEATCMTTIMRHGSKVDKMLYRGAMEGHRQLCEQQELQLEPRSSQQQTQQRTTPSGLNKKLISVLSLTYHWSFVAHQNGEEAAATAGHDVKSGHAAGHACSRKWSRRVGGRYVSHADKSR